jgi:hypothetical protein
MSHPDCFGAQFPDPARREPNRWLTGKVFSIRIPNLGLAEGRPETRVDREQWDRCQTCSSFTACRDLSFGTLLMRLAFHSP